MSIHSKSQPTCSKIPALIIHGGAGVGERDGGDPTRVASIHASLLQIVTCGGELLKSGKTALDVVEAVVRMLEDDPLFNAGRGGALTSEATIEHDATIMDGRDRRAGSVAVVGRVRNPIAAARAVMEHSPHVLMAGLGAEQFARQRGLELAAPWYFFTQQRLDALERVQKAAACAQPQLSEQDIHGTVGAVAFDGQGNLAAATSTGGRANKLPGRVGDSAVIGAGTFADNRFCALSATGSGEQFSRILFASRVSNLIELADMDLATASARALAEVQAIGGSGGVVGLDRDGQPVSLFTGKGMHRAYVRLGTAPEVAIYSGDGFTPDPKPEFWTT